MQILLISNDEDSAEMYCKPEVCQMFVVSNVRKSDKIPSVGILNDKYIKEGQTIDHVHIHSLHKTTNYLCKQWIRCIFLTGKPSFAQIMRIFVQT